MVTHVARGASAKTVAGNGGFGYFSAVCWIFGREVFDALGGKVPVEVMANTPKAGLGYMACCKCVRCPRRGEVTKKMKARRQKKQFPGQELPDPGERQSGEDSRPGAVPQHQGLE